jgi:hypothetical protein
MKVKNLNLDLICDVKTFDDDDMILVRLNKDKLHGFLKCKFDKVCEVLFDKIKGKSFSATAAGFNMASVSNENINALSSDNSKGTLFVFVFF